MIAVLVASVISLVTAALPAQADSTWIPNPNNGERVYLSRSCHDRGTGSCQENIGCAGHEGENVWSSSLATSALFDRGSGAGLVNRQYLVRIGDGLTSTNIASSNAWGALMHIPLHSNAGQFDCGSSQGHNWGTWGMYVSSRGRQLAEQLRTQIGVVSPGGNDQVVYRGDLGELTQTNAVAAYLEAEFHTYGAGVPWLQNEASWSWRIGLAVDQCRGYPRAPGGPTRAKTCTW